MLETKGVLVRIIDYSLSRLEIGQTSFFLTLSYFVQKILSPVYTINGNNKRVWFLPDDLTVSCDISKDEELFMGHGDYQFDIYRLMREENRYVHSQIQKKDVCPVDGICLYFKTAAPDAVGPFS